MKKTILILSSLLFCNQILLAQKNNTVISSEGEIISPKQKNKYTLSLGTEGVKIKNNNKPKDSSYKAINFGIGLDLGLNNVVDATQYANASLINIYNNVPVGTLDLKNNKSWNVNIWPLLASIHLYKKSINLNTGLGMQIYNFRYDHSFNFSTTSSNYIESTSHVYSKNKLAVNYLSIPLTLQFKPRIGNQHLVIGGGVIGGYLLRGWTKHIENGSKDKYNVSGILNDFNLSTTAEIGLDDKIRFYGTYSLTKLFKTDIINQTPYAFGIRFFGL